MVKFGKNKLKALNKLAKKQNSVSNIQTNKVVKKKLNTDKKVSFQREVLIRKVAESPLVTKVSAEEVILNKLTKKSEKKPKRNQNPKPKPKKVKPVEKQKKRQKTQLSDTKMLLNLMKKKS